MRPLAAQAAVFGGNVALAALLQLALFAYLSGPGLAGTADSAYYLYAARSLHTAGQLLHPDGTPYRYWPPLYPVLLAGVGGLAGLRLLHGACLLGQLLAWSWLGRLLLPPARAWLLPWAIALSTPALLVSKFVWAETGFLLLFAAYLLCLGYWLRTSRLGWLLAATLWGACLPLQRTSGFFLLAGVGVALLWRLAAGRRYRVWVLLHMGLSVAGGLVWHYYALLLAAPSVYQRNRGWGQLLSSAADYGFVLLRWLLPLRAGWYGLLPVAAWGLGLLALLLALAPRTKPPTRPEPMLWVLWLSTVGFVLLQLVATTFTRSAAGLHDAERYASVLWAPVLLLGLAQLPRPATRLGRWLLGAGLLLWLGYAAGRAVSNGRALRRLPPLAGWLRARAVPVVGRGSGPAARQ